MVSNENENTPIDSMKFDDNSESGPELNQSSEIRDPGYYERLELSKNNRIMRFKCNNCGKCCSDPKTFINITYLDIIRLVRGLKLSFEEVLQHVGFYVFNEGNIEEYMEKLVYAPIETEKGQAFLGLLRKEDGRCIFLDENNKCSIYDFRPMICRTFPFTFDLDFNYKDADRKDYPIIYTKKGIEYCEGIYKTAPIVKKRKINELLNLALYEIREDFKWISSWNSMVKEGKIKGEAKRYIYVILEFYKKFKEEEKQNPSAFSNIQLGNNKKKNLKFKNKQFNRIQKKSKSGKKRNQNKKKTYKNG